MNEHDDEAIKSLLNTSNDRNNDDQAIEGQRKAALARAKFNTAQQDTFALSLIKIWVALAEALAPVFALLAKKQKSELPKTHHKK